MSRKSKNSKDQPVLGDVLRFQDSRQELQDYVESVQGQNPRDEMAVDSSAAAPDQVEYPPNTKYNNHCLDHAGDDEPLFVLRAQDNLAPTVIRSWAQLAESQKANPEKIAEARALADLMEAWPFHKIPD